MPWQRKEVTKRQPITEADLNGTYLSPSSLRGARGFVAIQWVSLSVRDSKAALRAGFMTGLPRSARNDARSDRVDLRLR